MSMQCSNIMPRTLVVAAVLFGVFLASAETYAQEVEKVRPAENVAVPAGSQIPERRVREMEQKMEELKAQMRAKSSVQQQEQQLQEEAPKPQADKP